MVDFNRNPPPADPEPMLRLPDEFNPAVLGHTVDPNGPPRWVYSLNKMAAVLSPGAEGQELDVAREQVFQIVRRAIGGHGDRAPVFMDDTPQPEPEKGLKIWTPGG